jgi:hypothetical protein
MRNSLGLLTALLLSGCVAPGPPIESGLKTLIGQDIHAVIQRLGYPASQRVIAGDTIYTWSTSRHVEMDLPSTSTTTGNVNGEPFSATTTGTETMHLHFHCTIEVATGADGRVKSTQWEGNRGGCVQYARRLGN